jgi:peptidoglycan-N-acetylglucosamine deacetylase
MWTRRARREEYLENQRLRGSVDQMRVVPIVVVSMAAIGAALAGPSVKAPFDGKPTTPGATSAATTAKPDGALEKTATAASGQPEAAQPETKPAAKPAAHSAHKKSGAIKVEPNEFTNDPVLGKARRVHGEETTGIVTFTFDDGPNPETTPAVLDALKQYDIPATFFVVTRRLVGKIGEKSRELLARTMTEGHLIGSHSVTHAHLGKADTKKLDREMDRSFEMLAGEAKKPIGMFRAPFGALGGAGRARLKKLGVTEVFWSIDTLDWQAKHADKLRAKVLAMILKQKGGVVLMHDVKPITAEVIAGVLDDLEAENCRRLTTKQEPIWPVSMHYFLRDGKTRRAVPEDVEKRTEAYKKALPGRCAKRPPPVPVVQPGAQPVATPAK